jgi:parallel beta-helix repeat protein
MRKSILIGVLVLGLMAALLGPGISNDEHNGALAQPSCTVTVQPGQSIQTAIDRAQERAVICLAEGIWRENIVIEKSLTLYGAGKDDRGNWLTWIKGSEAGRPVLRIKSGTKIEVVIENFAIAEAKTFSPNKFCAARSPQWICPDGLQIWSLVQATIRNIQISGNPYVGLLLLGSAQATVTNASIFGNRFGIDMSGSAQVQINNTQIFSNSFYGIEILDKAKATLFNTTIKNNGIHCSNYICNGITVFDKVQLEIRDSHIINNNDWGIAAALIKCGYRSNSFTGRVMLVNNVIEGNRRGQICLP